MSLFSAPDFKDHEQVVFVSDATSGLKAIIAIHSTKRGPSLGGCRFWAYKSESYAIADALRLSRAMTYKSALARLPLGGGKCVVIGNASEIKTPALLRALGKSIDQLGGRYITAEDVGTKPSDIRIIGEETAYVAGLSESSGDPSPITALGVFEGLKAAVRFRLGADYLAGVTVAIQGLGSVGRALANQLQVAGARLIVADINQPAVDAAARDLGAEAVPVDEIYDVNADVFAPCALGAILNEETIPRLKVSVIAGSANNQLALPEDGSRLQRRRILYAPDYAINAGGIINIAFEDRITGTYDRAGALAAVGRIEMTLEEIFNRAESESRSTNEIADELAEERLVEVEI